MKSTRLVEVYNSYRLLDRSVSHLIMWLNWSWSVVAGNLNIGILLLIPGPVSTTIVRVAGESWTWDYLLDLYNTEILERGIIGPANDLSFAECYGQTRVDLQPDKHASYGSRSTQLTYNPHLIEVPTQSCNLLVNYGPTHPPKKGSQKISL